MLKNYKRILIAISIVWLAGAYFLYQNHDYVISYWQYIFHSPDNLKKQNPVKAAKYLKRAQERIIKRKIDLKIMKKSCGKIKMKARTNYFADTLSNFDWSKGKQVNTAQMPAYWKKEQPFVLLSLQDSLYALAFAYESKKELIPNYIALYSEAICRPYVAFSAWSEYISFKERIAYISSQKSKARDKRSMLSILSNDAKYIQALENYIGDIGKQGADNLEDFPSHETCSNKTSLNLSCVDPKESIIVLKKLIQIADKSRVSNWHLQIARSYLILSQEDKAKPAKEYHKKALTHLRSVTRASRQKTPARLLATRIYIKENMYKSALQELKYLRFINEQKDNPYHEKFRTLARRVLTGVGRFEDANCFAPSGINNSFYRTKAHTHCIKASL